MKQNKRYVNMNTETRTMSATDAKQWHNAGDDIAVVYLNANGSPFYTVYVKGAKVETKQEKQDRENWEHCKHVSDELDFFVNGNYHKCPHCNDTVYIPDTVGEKFKCPYCGAVDDVGEYDQLGIWDYMSDILDIDYLINSKKEFSACKILVAYGGPNIYISTISGAVELYWWTDHARYYMRSDTIDAVNDWAEEYYNCI